MEDKNQKTQPSALTPSRGQDKRRAWGIRYQLTEGPEQSRKSQGSKMESEALECSLFLQLEFYFVSQETKINNNNKLKGTMGESVSERRPKELARWFLA